MIFEDWDKTILSKSIVADGEAATAPENPIRDGYKFAGWNKDSRSVTADMTVTATYEALGESLENVPVNAGEARKLLRNGQIFILRGEKEYTLTGQEMK